jgi:hypothetical protein
MAAVLSSTGAKRGNLSIEAALALAIAARELALAGGDARLEGRADAIASGSLLGTRWQCDTMSEKAASSTATSKPRRTRPRSVNMREARPFEDHRRRSVSRGIELLGLVCAGFSVDCKLTSLHARCVKFPFWGVAVVLAALPSCGASDPKSTGSGGAPGVSGSSAGESGSGSSEAGSNNSHAGAAGTSGGASSGAGAGGSAVTGGGSGDAATDIPASTLTSDLNDTQKAELCDWHAGVFGGYGHVVNCGMGNISFPPDQATCVANSFSGFCSKATVGQFQDCVRSQIPSHGCNSTDECRRLNCL